eukprot:TRINITY_DN5153_c0_g1_i1.p1 TRINITY_DN5153_c0_g1~~TRINITY_DN5153_c0_g1_i1.p1  ORF type:complete len:191 (+),score=11.85 TRINITY_DN5153_c0_g1_i1:55-573(+)
MCSSSKNNPLGGGGMGVSFQEPQHQLEVMKTEWVCGTCTLFNPPMTARCTVCDSRPTREQLRSDCSSNIEPSQEHSETLNLLHHLLPHTLRSAQVIHCQLIHFQVIHCQVIHCQVMQSHKTQIVLDSSQNGHAPVSEWECQICTFINSAGHMNCGICNAPAQAVHALKMVLS